MKRYVDVDELKENICKRINNPAIRAWQNRLIDDTPTADVQEVRYGGWLPIPESEITGWNPEFAGMDPVGEYICSICNNEAIYSCNDGWVLSDFCPYCGARMGGNKE